MGTWGTVPVAYNGYMGASGHGYMGEGVQLLTVGTWEQGGVGTRGGVPAAYSGYMGARGQLLTAGT